MSYSDSINRVVNGALSIGAAAVVIDSARPLINGEYIQFSSHATFYQVSGCTETTFTIGPVLTHAVADNEVVTRADKYALMQIQDIIESVIDPNETIDDGLICQAYKIALACRSRIETKLGSPILQRTIDEFYSIEKERSQFRTFAGILGLQAPRTLAVGYSSSIGWDWPYNGGSIFTQLQLNKFPVVKINSVTMDGTVINSSKYSFNANDGILYYSIGFTFGVDNIEVNYDAGYPYVPQDFADIFVDAMRIMWAKKSQQQNILLFSQANNVIGPELSFQYRGLSELDDYLTERLIPYMRYKQIAV